jgi:hypothetical protein
MALGRGLLESIKPALIISTASFQTICLTREKGNWRLTYLAVLGSGITVYTIFIIRENLATVSYITNKKPAGHSNISITLHMQPIICS